MKFRLLGLLEVSERGRVIGLPRGKERALLAMLLLHANEPVSSDRLVDELWGERPPEHAAQTVRIYVSRLRKALGSDRVQTTPAGYLLQLRPSELDGEEFERLARQGHEALEGGEPHRADRFLAEALALWRGPALADFRFESFAQAEIRRLEELKAAARADRIDARLAAGEANGLVAELEELVATNPLWERPRGQLMLALYRAGRQAEALDLYRRTRALLADELGIEPSPQLQALERAILNQDPELATPARSVQRAVARRGGRLVLAGGVLIASAAVAATVLVSRGGGGLSTLAPGSIGLIRTRTNHIAAQIAVAGRPARLAVSNGSVWVVGDDSGTITAVDPERRDVTKLFAVGGFPSDVAAGEGALWVLDGESRVLAKVDPTYGPVGKRRLGRPNPLYDQSRESLDPTSVAAVAAGLGSVWTTDGTSRLTRVDPASLRVVGRTDLDAALTDVAVGAGAVWAISGTSASVIRLDPRGRMVGRITIVSTPGYDSPYPLAVDVGAGFVWVLNGNTATVTKIDPQQRTVVATIPIGIDRSPIRLAFGAGAAWVANRDGTLARIDPNTNETKIIPVGHRLDDVAVIDGTVVVTSGVGLAGGTLASPNVGAVRVHALPTSSCSPIYYEGGERPQFLIASDLPLQGPTLNVQLSQAIRFVLRQHRFRAGSLAVGYQSCDDSTAKLARWSKARCAANAHAYANDKSVIGVIGTVNSPCAQIELPILNRARGGPLAMVSPANSYVGLTHRGPGTEPGEPRRYYPTGTRNYVRVFAADDVQGAADALLAKQLRVRSVYSVSGRFAYDIGIAAAFRAAARRLGIRVVGSETLQFPDPQPALVAARVRKARADAVFIGTVPDFPLIGELIKHLRAEGIRIIAPDGFSAFDRTLTMLGPAAEGMTVSVAGLPNAHLPAAGKEFVAAFGRAVGQTPRPYSVRAAGAAEVLLDAIARSNGTRASVTRKLFETKIANGILGSFTFDANGDTTAAAVTIYRIAHGAPEVFRVITLPPPRLAPRHQ